MVWIAGEHGKDYSDTGFSLYDSIRSLPLIGEVPVEMNIRQGFKKCFSAEKQADHKRKRKERTILNTPHYPI